MSWTTTLSDAAPRQVVATPAGFDVNSVGDGPLAIVHNRWAFAPTSVPAPATVVLLGAGLGLVAWRRRRARVLDAGRGRA